MLASMILIAFVSYLLWDHSKKSVDTRPEEIAALASKNGWAFSYTSDLLNKLIIDNKSGYMGGSATYLNVCYQRQTNRDVYIFDCNTVSHISGVAIRFDEQNLPPLRVAERLILNRLVQSAADVPIEPSQLPQFVRAKVLAHAPADHHGQICQLLVENNQLQGLLKQRDLGYFYMGGEIVVFYFLTKYPAAERDFGKVIKRAEQIAQIFKA